MRGHKARSARAIIRTGQEVVNVAQEEEEIVGRVIRQGRRELRKGVIVKVVRHARLCLSVGERRFKCDDRIGEYVREPEPD